MNEAELHLETLRRLFPSIYGIRERVLEAIFDTSNELWKDGRLVPVYLLEGYIGMLEAVKNGMAPTVEELLWQHHLEHARKSFSESDRLLGTDIEGLAREYANIHADVSAIPPVYRMTEICQFYHPIFNIPDNVQPEWLAIAIEYLNNVASAKIDFDPTTILGPRSRDRFDQELQLTPEQIEARNHSAEKLLRKICEKEGRPYIPLTDEQRKQQHEKWEREYSPRARAERANADNKASIDCAIIIMNDLRRRKLVT